MKRLFAKRRIQGLTLVELMVAMVLGLVLMTGVIQMFVANKRTFMVSENMARLQENSRFAINFLVRDIQQSAYSGCVAASDDEQSSLKNILNGAPVLTNYSWPMYDSVIGYEASASSWTPALPSGIASSLPAYASLVNGSDVIEVYSFTGTAIRVVDDMTDYYDTVRVTGNTGLGAGDIVFLTDCIRGIVFQVTGVTSGTAMDTITHTASTTVSPGNAIASLLYKYEADKSELMRTVRTRYFIAEKTVDIDGDGTDETVRSLWRQRGESGAAEEIVEGVEGMQVRFALTDNDEGETAVAYVDAADVSTDVQWGGVNAIQLSLLMGTLRENMAESDQDIDFDGSTTTYTDGKLRQVVEQTVSIRNRAR